MLSVSLRSDERSSVRDAGALTRGAVVRAVLARAAFVRGQLRRVALRLDDALPADLLAAEDARVDALHQARAARRGDFLA